MTRPQHSPLYDAIVAGAGPVGLFLACELALAGCTVLVLERAADPHSPLKQLPFGIRGLSAPTIAALDRRGLLDELEVPKRLRDPFAAGTSTQATPRRQAGHFAGIPLHGDAIDAARWGRLPDASATSLIAEMAELESVLARRARDLGVTVRRGLAVDALAQDADGVTVRSGATAFAGRWLIGCDGSRSAVRKAGGFDFAGTEPEFTGYTTRVDIAAPDPLPPGRHLTAGGLFFQSQPGHVVIQDFDGGAFHDAGAPATLAHVQALLRRISGTGVTLDALHVAATWTDRARQATRYRNGRILLAGDSAHIHSPLGGQGLNLGLGDAMNLGWKLAAVIRGNAPAGLLDSYHAERHPVGAAVLDWSRAQVALMRPDPAAQALRAIVQDLMATPDGATYVAGRIWGVALAYELGGAHPLVGRGVPEFAYADGTRVGTRIGTLLRDGRGMLLDFEGDAGKSDAALAALALEYGLRYRAGKPLDDLGLRALLVRPDGIVAWAGFDATVDLDALRAAAGRWFSCGSGSI